MKRYSARVLANTRESIRQIRELDKKNPWRVRIRRIILTIILGGIILGCLYWFAILGEDIPDDKILDAFKKEEITSEQIAETDPFNTLGPDDVDPWETDGSSGLVLEVVNALEPKWHPYFDQAGTFALVLCMVHVVGVQGNSPRLFPRRRRPYSHGLGLWISRFVNVDNLGDAT